MYCVHPKIALCGAIERRIAKFSKTKDPKELVRIQNLAHKLKKYKDDKKIEWHKGEF
jgi:hypothetical protein